MSVYFTERNECPVCKSGDNKELYNNYYTEPPLKTYLEAFYSEQGMIELDYLTGVKYILFECLNCGLVYQKYIPTEFLMTKLYGEWIDCGKIFENKVKRRQINYYIKLRQEIEAIISYIGSNTYNLTFLDYGMGWGDWCRMANAYGVTVYGTELAEAKISHANRHGVVNIPDSMIAENEFDFINTEQVFEHIADPLEMLKYLCASLNHDGIIRISVPNGHDIKGRLEVMDWRAPKGSKYSLNLVAPLEHINCFNENSLIYLAKLAGLKKIDVLDYSSVKKSLIDYSLRGFIKPIYRKARVLAGIRHGSTNLYFMKSQSDIKNSL